jgi:hypothetical protein
MKMSRTWEMPSKDTFTMEGAAKVISDYMGEGEIWVDPFAGDNSPASITNDLSPHKAATYHMKAGDFVTSAFIPDEIDGVLLDPPYSPTQMKVAYESVGLKEGFISNAALYKEVHVGLSPRVKMGGHCISFGWNSAGFGKKNGFEIVEIILIAHGGAHNDTIVTVERKIRGSMLLK